MSAKGIALVTGAGRGIGAACARELSAAGFQVAVHYNSSAGPAEKVAAELPGSFLVQGDVSTVEGCDALYDVLKKEHEGNLAVLVNNAGIALDNPLFTASLEEFDRTIQTNLRSVFYLTKRLSRLMIRKKSGRIINLSSVVAGEGNPAQAVYGMSKAAIENFTKTAAKELAEYNILVNAVAPGFIATDMTENIPAEFRDMIMKQIPLGRMGRPDEVAAVVRFLAESGTYITGTVIHVNGGMYGG